MFSLATVNHHGAELACIESAGRFYPLPEAASRAGLSLPPGGLINLFDDWAGNFKLLERIAAQCQPGGGLAATDVKVLTPLRYPGKVLCAGANYYDHIAEMGVPDITKAGQRLFFFFKPPRNALVGPGRTVEYPLGCTMFDWEIELAAVIGKTSKRLTLDNALESVAAYSIAIDFSARDFNRAPETFYKLDWVAGKGRDTCCPLGPRLVPAAFIKDPHDLALKLTVNGAVKQDARTSGMIFDIREQLVTLSNIMTLDPGDVVLTGTPAGVGMPKRTFLAAGDKVCASIESIGELDVEIFAP